MNYSTALLPAIQGGWHDFTLTLWPHVNHEQDTQTKLSQSDLPVQEFGIKTHQSQSNSSCANQGTCKHLVALGSHHPQGLRGMLCRERRRGDRQNVA